MGVRLQCLLFAASLLAAAGVPCQPAPAWAERAQARAEMPCHQEAHAAHSATHHDAEWKTPCPCGCGGKAMPGARGGRLGFAIALAPPRAPEAHSPAPAPEAAPRLPRAPTRLLDPVPI